MDSLHAHQEQQPFVLAKPLRYRFATNPVEKDQEALFFNILIRPDGKGCNG